MIKFIRDLLLGVWDHLARPLQANMFSYDHIIFMQDGEIVQHDGAEISPEKLEKVRQVFRGMDKAMEHMDDAFREMDQACQHILEMSKKDERWRRSEKE
jgi:hypothetical protein